jgi:membrane glycosyltransferase
MEKTKVKGMSFNEIIMLLTVTALLLFSVWLLSYTLNEAKKGYKSHFGNDIKLYFGAISGMILGLVLIIRSLFW